LAAHFVEVAAFDGEEAALIGAVFVDAAGGRPVTVLLEEGALEENFAARAAAIAFALAERKFGDDLIFAKVGADEAA
jgi:hypothetical protein